MQKSKRKSKDKRVESLRSSKQQASVRTVPNESSVDYVQVPSAEESYRNLDTTVHKSIDRTSTQPQSSTQATQTTHATQTAQTQHNHGTSLSPQLSKLDDKLDDSINLSRSSTTHVQHKLSNICPPALRERGYEINEEIGGGAFSKVYKAKYKVLFEKEIAVKVISLDKVPEFWREKCLKQELKILRKLQHPHIIKVWDIIKTRRNVFIFMDLAEHNSISHYLQEKQKESKHIAESKCRFWFTQTTGAISYMHSKGIAHRDLKLENILLDHDYHAKITDFGFSCFTYDKESRQALLSPTLCGTQAYTAPEVYTPPYEARIADIWSLGVCLFEMATARKPFEEQASPKKFVKILLKRDLRYPSFISNHLSDDLKDLINKLLECDPEQRLTANQILSHPWVVIGYTQPLIRKESF